MRSSWDVSSTNIEWTSGFWNDRHGEFGSMVSCTVEEIEGFRGSERDFKCTCTLIFAG